MIRSALLLAALAAGPAFAGGLAPAEPELPVVAAVPAPPPSADWSGPYAGLQLGYGDIDSNGAGLDGSGWVGGVHAGYRWDLGTTVLGVEGDWDQTRIDLGGTTGELDSVARLKLVGGAELGRSFLYATGGLARARATVGGADLSDNGWFLGAGVDFAVTEQWTVGAEVLGHRFDDFDGTGIDLDATTARARVSFNF